MEKTFAIRGKWTNSRHIELDEPVSDIRGPVEVTVPPIPDEEQTPIFESSTQEEWERAFHDWIRGHDRTTPIPSPESLRREALYDDRS